MKHWKLAYKITAINCGIVVFIGLICGAASPADEFALALGIICLIGALIDLALGVIILIAGSKDWGKGFLNSAGILLLLSGISCGTGLANVNFH
jgi:hypothetical protein